MSLYLGTTPIAVNSSSREIGEIILSTIPLTDAGLHLLDGSVISGSGSYSAFVTHIAELVSGHQELFTTEANWQIAVTTYGVCGKFVYDSINNTVRLPKYSDKFWSGLGTAGVKGNGMTLGLTSGSTEYGLALNRRQSGTDYGMATATAASQEQPVGSSYTFGSSAVTGGLTTNVTKSGIVADLSTITTALDGYWYIVIATSTKTQIEVDIDEIATDLNGKADVDLSNCTKPHIVETYVNGTEWYRVYSDGWCEQGGYVTPTATTTTINLYKAYDNTNYTILSGASYVSNSNLYSPTMGVSKTTSSFSIYTNSTSYRYWWEAKGYTR